MIVGLGVELVETERFAAALERFDGRLHTRLFTAAERVYASQRGRAAESLGVRFAAKVAARPGRSAIRGCAGPRSRWCVGSARRRASRSTVRRPKPPSRSVRSRGAT